MSLSKKQTLTTGTFDNFVGCFSFSLCNKNINSLNLSFVLMRLFNCYHPKLVLNQYTHEMVLARCGKCPACLNARASQWVQRLDVEMQTCKYTFFTTLQYDEYNVNQFLLLRSEDNPNSLPSYIDGDSGQIISLSDVTDVTQADINYCYNTKVLLVPSVRDIQLFLKRLRKYISKHYGSEKIRYYIALELGPTTIRPHAHCLFFFNSTLLAQDFGKLCTKYWQYGTVFDTHSVSGSASQYVASYVNCLTHLPKIYLHKEIRPRTLFSKKPPIGFNWLSEQDVKRIFNSLSLEFTIFKRNVSSFSDVPLWRTVQNRLFPKITAFDRLTRYDRTLLYRKGFTPAYRQRNIDAICADLTTPYWLPYFRTAFQHKNKVTHVQEVNKESIQRFCSVVCRVCDNCARFNISLSNYVLQIEKFYDKKSKSDLKEWYTLQDDYFKEHPVSDFLIMSSNFVLETNGKLFGDLSPAKRFYLRQYYPNKVFGYDEKVNIHLTDSFAYRELVKLHDKISFDNTKQKKANDYLMSHRDKFNNIITYNQEINDYVKK